MFGESASAAHAARARCVSERPIVNFFLQLANYYSKLGEKSTHILVITFSGLHYKSLSIITDSDFWKIRNKSQFYFIFLFLYILLKIFA